MFAKFIERWINDKDFSNDNEIRKWFSRVSNKLLLFTSILVGKVAVKKRFSKWSWLKGFYMLFIVFAIFKMSTNSWCVSIYQPGMNNFS